MGRKKSPPPLRKKVQSTRFDSLKSLPCFQEVHNKIAAGAAANRVVDYIHQQGLLLEVPREKLSALVQGYRKSLSPAELLLQNMPEDVLDAKDRFDTGLNELDELHRLYRIQTGRINRVLRTEAEMNLLLPTTRVEVQAAESLLLSAVKTRVALGLGLEGDTDADEGEVTTVLIQKIKGRTTNPEVLQLLATPEGRAKLVHLHKRVRGVLGMESKPTIDTEGEDSGDPHEAR